MSKKNTPDVITLNVLLPKEKNSAKTASPASSACPSININQRGPSTCQSGKRNRTKIIRERHSRQLPRYSSLDETIIRAQTRLAAKGRAARDIERQRRAAMSLESDEIGSKASVCYEKSPLKFTLSGLPLIIAAFAAVRSGLRAALFSLAFPKTRLALLRRHRSFALLWRPRTTSPDHWRPVGLK